MMGEATRFRGSAGHGGLLSSALAFIGALASFIESRLELLASAVDNFALARDNVDALQARLLHALFAGWLNFLE